MPRVQLWKPREWLSSNDLGGVPILRLSRWQGYSYTRLSTGGSSGSLTSSRLRRKTFFILAFVSALLVFGIVSRYPRKIEPPPKPKTRVPTLQKLLDGEKDNDWTSPEWDPLLPVYKKFDNQSYASGSNAYKQEAWQPYIPQAHKNSSGFVSCYGPRGKRLNESAEDSLHAFHSSIQGFPAPTLGGNVFDLDQNVCFDGLGLRGPAGHKLDKHASGAQRQFSTFVEWHNVDWAMLQDQCIEDNGPQFDAEPRLPPWHPEHSRQIEKLEQSNRTKRTAILIRGMEGMRWTDELRELFRSLIMQLTLASNGEYECFLLYNLHTPQQVPFSNLTAVDFQRLKNDLIPQEFHKITTIWNEQLWESRYPKLPEVSRLVHLGQWIPIQWFAKQHPEFDFYFNWELDVRYTGHLYDLVSKVSEWAKQQPRKGSWERSSRFYVPELHKSYANFSNSVLSRYADKPISEDDNGLIWGPYKQYGQDYSQPWDPAVPEMNDEWGVGEDADLISFNTIFEPVATNYANVHAWWNYKDIPAGGRPKENEPNRRATIVTMMRLSHRLVSTMEWENTEPGHHMGSEMWPQTVALHHGLKAVYAPHPIYTTRKWPGQAADFIFNNGDVARVVDQHKELPRTGAGSGGPDSVFGLGREFNFFEQASFYYRAILSMDFFRRLDGQEVEGIGGSKWEADHGTYCLPPMLLHPVHAFDERDPEPQR